MITRFGSVMATCLGSTYPDWPGPCRWWHALGEVDPPECSTPDLGEFRTQLELVVCDGTVDRTAMEVMPIAQCVGGPGNVVHSVKCTFCGDPYTTPTDIEYVPIPAGMGGWIWFEYRSKGRVRDLA